MPSPGYLSLLYSVSKKPLENWSKRHSQTGRVWKTLDSDLLENVVELQDLQKSNNSNTSITCPAQTQQFLNVELPLLVIIVKNMNVECSFIVQVISEPLDYRENYLQQVLGSQVIDDDQTRHHFHFSNELLDPNAAVKTPVISRVHVKLEPGWNRVEIDLDDFTRRAFNSRYKATQRLAIHANCRLRRVYFIDRHYDDFEMSAELCHAVFDRYLMKVPAFHVTRKSLCAENRAAPKANHSQFLRHLQTKSATLINDFFSRTRTKLDNVFDFRSKMRLMFLAIPRIGDQGSLDMICRQKSKCDSIRCMTPTRNETSLQGVAYGKQLKTEPGKILEDPLEAKLIVHLVPITKPSQIRSKCIRKPRKQDKSGLKNREKASNDQRGFSIDPKIVVCKSPAKNKEGKRSKEAVNSLEGPVKQDRDAGDQQKTKLKRKKRVGTLQSDSCN